MAAAIDSNTVTMAAPQVLAQAKALGVVLTLSGGELRAKGDKAGIEQLAQHIRACKPELVKLLASPPAMVAPAPAPPPQPVALPVPVTPAMLAVPGCSNCEAATTKQWHGGYTMQCVGCMARLVLSARPLRHAQEAMLACLESKGSARPGLPTRQQVLERLQRR